MGEIRRWGGGPAGRPRGASVGNERPPHRHRCGARGPAATRRKTRTRSHGDTHGWRQASAHRQRAGAHTRAQHRHTWAQAARTHHTPAAAPSPHTCTRRARHGTARTQHCTPHAARRVRQRAPPRRRDGVGVVRISPLLRGVAATAACAAAGPSASCSWLYGVMRRGVDGHRGCGGSPRPRRVRVAQRCVETTERGDWRSTPVHVARAPSRDTLARGPFASDRARGGPGVGHACAAQGGGWMHDGCAARVRRARPRTQQHARCCRHGAARADSFCRGITRTPARVPARRCRPPRALRGWRRAVPRQPVAPLVGVRAAGVYGGAVSRAWRSWGLPPAPGTCCRALSSHVSVCVRAWARDFRSGPAACAAPQWSSRSCARWHCVCACCAAAGRRGRGWQRVCLAAPWRRPPRWRRCACVRARGCAPAHVCVPSRALLALARGGAGACACGGVRASACAPARWRVR